MPSISTSCCMPPLRLVSNYTDNSRSRLTISCMLILMWRFFEANYWNILRILGLSHQGCYILSWPLIGCLALYWASDIHNSPMLPIRNMVRVAESETEEPISRFMSVREGSSKCHNLVAVMWWWECPSSRCIRHWQIRAFPRMAIFR
jgi:hypothetical protein